MGGVTRILAGVGLGTAAALAVTTFTPESTPTSIFAPANALLTPASNAHADRADLLGAADVALWSPTPAHDPTCQYVVNTDHPVPLRSGPGESYPARARLAPSDEPLTATCAAPGQGAEHWVRLKSGGHKGLWLWRDRVRPWTG
ncbi:hypothetical protein E1286_17875 [Nonomuraea terrae]|uniref:SH3 domain-containing protein n=1 Tax=Nonomuraea terrae TaxID=2530383 RepID=A0A4R4YQC4_9ACTN|nr:hypothetical protein [Nonomuraea terrae]TDD47398.1 hypothetical protein E1286_17875 [Nonomuraea terrae]